MKEYIDKDAARDLMEQALADEWEIQYADDRLDEIPAADVVEVQDALAFSQTFNFDEYRGKEDQRDCDFVFDFVFGVLMRLGIVCLKMYDPTTRTMKLWVEKVDGGADDGRD